MKNGAPLFSGHTSPRDKASFDELGLTDQSNPNLKMKFLKINDSISISDCDLK